MTFARRRVGARHGEDFLDGVEAVSILLENGKVATLRIKDELLIPDDPVALLREAKQAPARLAFWSYQAERALSQLRTFERQCASAAGHEYHLQRTFIVEHTDAEMPTEGNIRARMDNSPELNVQKERVETAQRRYGVLRAVRDALEHRSHLLRKLISREFEAG